MEWLDKIWKYFTELPRLLNAYSAFSYSLLAVLLLGGVAIMVVHFLRKRMGGEGLATVYLIFAGVLVFLSLGGGFLKLVVPFEETRSRQLSHQRFIDKHRAPKGEHWLLIFDFSLPPSTDPALRQQYLQRMKQLAGTMAEVLLEDLPPEFRQPRVVPVRTDESPWSKGIGQDNFDEVIRGLNAFEIMWGDVHAEGKRAKVFLGISQEIAKDLDRIVPLRDFAFDQDPRLENQFGDGYYRLLGLVTLGMALDTYWRGQQAQGEEHRRLFLLASQQFNKARELVNNQREDPMLKRTLYSRRVDEFIAVALREGGLTP
jgi:hypothetical protein